MAGLAVLMLVQVEGVLLAQPVLPSRLEHGSCRKATPGFTPSVPPIVGGGLPLAMACVGLVTSLRRRSKHYAG